MTLKTILNLSWLLWLWLVCFTVWLDRFAAEKRQFNDLSFSFVKWKALWRWIYVSWYNWINLIVVKFDAIIKSSGFAIPAGHFGTFRTICWCENYEMTFFSLSSISFRSSKPQGPLITMKSTQLVATIACLSRRNQIMILIDKYCSCFNWKSNGKRNSIESNHQSWWFDDSCVAAGKRVRSILLPPYLSISLHPDLFR